MKDLTAHYQHVELVRRLFTGFYLYVASLSDSAYYRAMFAIEQPFDIVNLCKRLNKVAPMIKKHDGDKELAIMTHDQAAYDKHDLQSPHHFAYWLVKRVLPVEGLFEHFFDGLAVAISRGGSFSSHVTELRNGALVTRDDLHCYFRTQDEYNKAVLDVMPKYKQFWTAGQPGGDLIRAMTLYVNVLVETGDPLARMLVRSFDERVCLVRLGGDDA